MTIEKYFNVTEAEILAELKEKYSNDEEVLEIIARTEVNLEYMNSGSYKGTQTPKQRVLELVGFLKTWY